jgi:hypothetical protein
MKLVISRKGKLTENRMLLIIQKAIDEQIGEYYEVVNRVYFYEGQTSVPLWPGQQCAWVDEWDPR